MSPLSPTIGHLLSEHEPSTPALRTYFDSEQIDGEPIRLRRYESLSQNTSLPKEGEDDHVGKMENSKYMTGSWKTPLCIISAYIIGML
jgi:hypothetical protein